MSQPISKDLRQRIVASRAEGASYEELAERFRVGRATISRLLRLQRETTSVEPRPHGGGMPPRISAEDLPAFRDLVDEFPDATLEELAVLASERFGRSMSRATIGRALVRLRLLAKEEGAHPSRAKSPKRRGSPGRVPRRNSRRAPGGPAVPR